MEIEESYHQPPKRNFVDKSNATVYICGEIDDTILTDVLPDLDDLVSAGTSLKDDLKIITFKISSIGGKIDCLFALLDIFAELRTLGFKIATQIRGYANSCASVLAMCGDKGLRTCGQYSTSVIHHFKGSDFIQNKTEIDRSYYNAKKLSDTIKKLYLQHSKLKDKDYDKIVSAEHYKLDANEMLKLGLVDYIVKDK